jgi:adenylate kinase
MRVVLLGPPGAGKGTQAQRLAAITGAAHLSIGEVVRAEIAAQTPLGHTLQGYHDRGDLIPDRLILELVTSCMARVESWILDGFPRTETQARALDATLTAHGAMLDRVIWLDLPDEAVIQRLAGRRQSRTTGQIYQLADHPPPPDDPGPFVQRADDTPQNIRHRLEIYHAVTEPLKAYYAGSGLLTEIDGREPISTITDAILRALRKI